VAYRYPTRPTEVTWKRGRFDALADWASTLAARSSFFVGVLAAVVAWLVVGPIVSFSHHWIDVVVVVVGVVTLLLVALVEAVAHILAADESAGEQVKQLRAAYGLEKRESTSG
jgi:low affinity Fe/Cu permease